MGATSGDVNTQSMLCATLADLASRPVASKQSGDQAWVVDQEAADAGPLYFFKRGSAATAGTGVVTVTGGQWLSDQLFGPLSQTAAGSSFLAVDTTLIAGNIFAPILTVAATTYRANEKLLIIFTSAGHSTAAAVSRFEALLQIDGVPVPLSGGTGGTSTATTDIVSGSIAGIFTIPAAGAHTIEVLAACITTNFIIPAQTAPEQANGRLNVVRLG